MFAIDTVIDTRIVHTEEHETIEQVRRDLVETITMAAEADCVTGTPIFRDMLDAAMRARVGTTVEYLGAPYTAAAVFVVRSVSL